jgi:hypothetical protein
MVQEFTINMPIVSQELYYEFLRKVAAIRYRMHSISVRKKQGDEASDSVLKRFTAAIESSGVPGHLESLLPQKMKELTVLISRDPREITEPVLLDCFRSAKLFVGGNQV